MAFTVTHKKSKSAVIHCDANTTLVVAGNSSQSNVATSDEVLTGAYIKQLWWGAAGTAYWNVKRNSNTVMVLTGSGWMDLAAHGCPITRDNAANLVFELVGTANGALQVEIQKIANSGYFTTTDYRPFPSS